MKTERMRQILAEGMGLTWYVNPYNDSEWWILPNETAMQASDWQPDSNWPQCGMVIAVMREKGWQWHVADGYENGQIRITLTDAMGNGPVVFDEDERYARMLAAARALESEANDGG